MPISLKTKFKSMRYKGRIDEAEYQALIKKLNGHDSALLDRVAEQMHKKMCSENCGERQCVDAMDRCVWYWYVDEVISELKEEISE